MILTENAIGGASGMARRDVNAAVERVGPTVRGGEFRLRGGAERT